MNKELTMDKLVNICKNYGFIFQGSEIYGGLANTWDFGPVGVELKKNVKNAWMKKFIQPILVISIILLVLFAVSMSINLSAKVNIPASAKTCWFLS